MATRPAWLSVRSFYGDDGELKATARAFLQEVFRENVEVQPDGCWHFLPSWGSLERYRRLWWGTQNVAVHRFAYELFCQRIPDGLFVLHSCDNPPCCNPEHLRHGTAAENEQDKVARGRAGNTHAHITHCPQGHPYDEANTYVHHGSRQCRACHKVFSADWARRNRERNRENLRRWRASKRAT